MHLEGTRKMMVRLTATLCHLMATLYRGRHHLVSYKSYHRLIPSAGYPSPILYHVNVHLENFLLVDTNLINHQRYLSPPVIPLLVACFVANKTFHSYGQLLILIRPTDQFSSRLFTFVCDVLRDKTSKNDKIILLQAECLNRFDVKRI